MLDRISRRIYENFPPGFDLAGVREDDPSATARLAETEVLVTCLTIVNRPLLEKLPQLRFLQKFGVGVDRLDLPALWEKGVQVSNTQGNNATAVADHALVLTLVLARQFVGPYLRLKQHGEWRGAGEEAWELAGKTMGILGYGHIGRAVARRATGFEMRVIAWNRNPERSRPPEDGVEFFSLEQVLRESDVLCIATPLSQQTRGLMNAERLALMKPTAVLINVGRGPIVDESALVEAVETGRLAGAGLDVTAVEPLPPDSPLLKVDRIVITPHYAGGSDVAMARGREYVYENVARYLRGETPLRLVTPDML